MDATQWTVLHLLCMLLVHASLSAAAAEVGWSLNVAWQQCETQSAQEQS